MTIMFHSFDILRINMFIIHYRMLKKKVGSTTHYKLFTMVLVSALQERSREARQVRKGRDVATTRAVTNSAAVVSPLPYNSSKK